MIIACDVETMKGEGRVALMPQSAKELVANGTEVLVVKSTGVKSGFGNMTYKDAGAIITSRDSAWNLADLVVRVKQPLPEDFRYFRYGKMIACFSHLAINQPLMEYALKTGVTLIDYGTIQREDGSTHILAAMSKIAGKQAVVTGEYLLEKHRGKILGPETNAAIIGMGNAGLVAAERILAAGAHLFCFDKNPAALTRTQNLFQQFSPYQVWYLTYDHNNPSDQRRLAEILTSTDLLIGCTHEVGRHTGKPVSTRMIEGMPRSSIAVDISIDMGGCFESSSYFFETGKQHFVRYGVRHVCEPNMPGRVPKISTPELCNQTLPYLKEITQKGFARAVHENSALAKGVNTYKGWITHAGLAKSVGREGRYKPLSELLN